MQAALPDLAGDVLAARSGCPCPCRARAGGSCGSGRRSRRRAACRFPRTTTSVGCGTSNSIPSGACDRDRVRVAERQLQGLALELGAVADALDLEAPLEAVGDALDHVRDQAAREAVQGAVLAAVGRALDGQGAVVDRRPSCPRSTAWSSSPFGPLTVTSPGLTSTLTPSGIWDWLSSDSAHESAPITRRRRRPRRRRPSCGPRGRSSRRSRWRRSRPHAAEHARHVACSAT